MTKKKVAFIIQHLANGGAERTISNLSMALEKECDITIIVFDGNNCTYPYGGRMVDLAIPPTKSAIGKVFNALHRILKVRSIRKQESFDCVISFMFGANLVNVLSNCGEKTIISERNYLGAYGRTFFNKFRVKFIARRCDIDVSLSKMVEYDLINNFRLPASKVKTIYNPLDVDKILTKAKQKSTYTFDSDCFYISSAGRFVKQKGQWHLIKAFSIFHKRYPNSKLLLLGDGELKNSLVKLSEDLQIRHSIDFLGFQENPYCYFYNSSCFILSSLFEGLGNVILEAMACKVPVISYDCLAGPRELIAPEVPINKTEREFSWYKCGILVSPPDYEMHIDTRIEKCDMLLADAMESLYNNRTKATSVIESAYEWIKEFSPERIIEQWKALF